MMGIENIRVVRQEEKMDLIISFDNDRYHAINFVKGDSQKAVVYTLHKLAALIECDQELKGKI
jgi:hypothetical protein